MSDQSAFICPRCQIGRCHPDRITYVHMYEGSVLRVPNMPAYTCDVCGYQELEPAAMARLEMLVGKLDTPVEDSQTVAKTPPIDAVDAADASTRRPKP